MWSGGGGGCSLLSNTSKKISPEARATAAFVKVSGKLIYMTIVKLFHILKGSTARLRKIHQPLTLSAFPTRERRGDKTDGASNAVTAPKYISVTQKAVKCNSWAHAFHPDYCRCLNNSAHQSFLLQKMK